MPGFDNKALPESSWAKIESAAVEEARRPEVLRIPIASGPPFDRHDRAVDSFGHAVGDSVLTVRQEEVAALSATNGVPRAACLWE